MENFEPSLALIKKTDGEYTLHSVTPTPNSCFQAGRAEFGVPSNVIIIPEAVGVLLHIRNNGGPICLPVITPVKHQLGDIKLGGDSGKSSVIAFAVLGGRVVGSSSISVNDASKIVVADDTTTTCPIDSSQWSAWVDLQPPGPKSLHVQGIVCAPTPGHQATLEVASPQGINPRELILDVRLTPLPGLWPQVVTPIPAVYEDPKYKGDHETVLVRLPDGAAFQLEIQEIH